MRARWYRTAASAAVLMFALVLAGPALAVTVTSYTPTNAFIPEDPGACVGTSITINGTGFVNDGGTVTVKFNGTPGVNVVIGSDNTIYAKMPPTASGGLVSVTTGAGTATATTPYEVVPCASHLGPALIAAPSKKPSIGSFTPAKAKTGATVTITGANLTGATTVKIGGVAAKFKVVSSTKITATVSATAKSGKITVASAAGTATSSKSFTKT